MTGPVTTRSLRGRAAGCKVGAVNTGVALPPLAPDALSWLLLGLVIAAAAVVATVVLVLIRGERRHAETALRLNQVAGLTEALSRTQGELAGRLDTLGDRLGDGLIHQTERTGESLRAVHERLAVVDAAGRTIADLSSRIAALQALFGNKQARGAFGERQLEDLIRGLLPPSAFRFQATLSTGVRADCLLRLADPPGPIVIDAKFPLESYAALKDAPRGDAEERARRAFTADVVRHLRDIAGRYVIPGETADQALMFLPAEAMFADLHAHFRSVVEESFRLRVWLVSPTTLWATLTTLSSVLRETRLRAQAGLIAAELATLAADAARLDHRAERLTDHLRQAEEDLRQIRISAQKLAERARRIDVADLTPEEASQSGK